MIEAAEEARRDSEIGQEVFMNDRRNRAVLLLDLIHLTESADKLSVGFKKSNPTIGWRRLRELRNEGLVHDYPEADFADIWSFVRNELPKLRRQLNRVSYPR
jgi:uncharacterized protein with HEPN domain